MSQMLVQAGYQHAARLLSLAEQVEIGESLPWERASVPVVLRVHPAFVGLFRPADLQVVAAQFDRVRKWGGKRQSPSERRTRARRPLRPQRPGQRHGCHAAARRDRRDVVAGQCHQAPRRLPGVRARRWRRRRRDGQQARVRAQPNQRLHPGPAVPTRLTCRRAALPTAPVGAATGAGPSRPGGAPRCSTRCGPAPASPSSARTGCRRPQGRILEDAGSRSARWRPLTFQTGATGARPE